MSETSILLGTRGSELALKQTRMVTELLLQAEPGLDVNHRIIHTTGDKRQDVSLAQTAAEAGIDKGVFIKELEVALEDREIDAAVHSLKDVPSALPPQFRIAAILERAVIEDVLISAGGHSIKSLPSGARVGTSSPRRARQLLWMRPDLRVVDLRGNVPTRVRKCLGESPLDAIILAAAGLVRLDLLDFKTNRITIDGQQLHAEILDPREFYPAAGQGAIAIEVCSDLPKNEYNIIRKLNHSITEARVTAERSFLCALGAGCQTPVGAHTWVEGSRLHMAVRVFSEDDLNEPPRECEADAPVDCPLTLSRQIMKKLA